MTEAESRRLPTSARCRSVRTPDIFADWWLTAFGAALAALYLVYFGILYRAGTWVLGPDGVPIYTDFGCGWAAGVQAWHGMTTALYDPATFARAQAALFPASHSFYPNWPYPPIFLLLMAPLGLLPYREAFLVFDVATLAGCIWAVSRIVPRRAAVALALAAPFTAWNFLAAQNGFLTAALIGGGLLLLERRPVWAGLLIGCLTYKPQFGILFPVALVACGNWRAIGSAAATAVVLAGISAAAFGLAPWLAFPNQLMAQTALNLTAGEGGNWGYLQTVYGLVRHLHGSTASAAGAQALLTAGLAVVTWRVWRSSAAYPLKAAALSAAALLASPYAFAYDMAALVVPAALLAADQLRRGLLPADKVFWIALFGVPLASLVTLGDNAGGPTFGGTPIGLAAAAALFCAILRRVALLPKAAAVVGVAEPGCIR